MSEPLARLHSTGLLALRRLTVATSLCRIVEERSLATLGDKGEETLFDQVFVQWHNARLVTFDCARFRRDADCRNTVVLENVSTT